MIGESRLTVEAFGEGGHGAQVEAFGLAWVSGNALEQYEFASSVVTQGGYGLGYFVFARHAGAEDDGLSGVGDFLE